MPGQPLYVEDIVAALRESRISNETATRWLDMRLADHRRQVRAHATPAMVESMTKRSGRPSPAEMSSRPCSRPSTSPEPRAGGMQGESQASGCQGV